MGVSRRHVKIEEDAERKLVLSDLNSLNGTYVNGKKVRKVMLSSGDKITIGKYMILYEESNAANYAASVPSDSQIVSFPPAYGLAEARVPVQQPPRTQPVSVPIPEQKSEKESNAVLIETNKHVVYKLDKPVMTIGSGENDDIFVSGFMIGEGQASIEKKSDGIQITASKMMGKIKVNGKSVRSHLLEHKDRIEIGSSTFRFMENG
ncbi:MAG: FHA domain-containing protein, partial [Fibrobacter sp.]|nr:FHA domain-containing protein [Fibrobacter sp.]